MQIRYEVTAQDHVAFMLYHYHQREKSVRRNELVGIWIIICIALATTALPAWSRHETTRAGVCVAIGALVGLLWPGFARWSRRSRVERIASTLDRGALGIFEMEITDRGIVVRTSWGEASTWWQGILGVEETPEYLFVRTSSVSAHIVPKGRILQGDVVDLESALRDGLARQRVPAPPPRQREGGDAQPAVRDGDSAL